MKYAQEVDCTYEFLRRIMHPIAFFGVMDPEKISTSGSIYQTQYSNCPMCV